MFNWIEISNENIINGFTVNGVSYLELFLIEYVKKFNEQPNAGCGKCLNSYINKYKNAMTESNCKYKLLPDCQGLPLEFGSDIYLTNQNLTDEYAEKIIENYLSQDKNFELQTIFEKFPKVKK